MTLDCWDDTARITYDHAVWNEPCSLRFVESGHDAVIMGPVGVGKTFFATALGHAAVRRRFSVHFERCDRLLKRLRASRLDNSHDIEMRRLLRVDLLIIDDFALQPLDPLDTADIYELIVERHRAAELVLDGECYRQRQEPGLTQHHDDLDREVVSELVEVSLVVPPRALPCWQGSGVDLDTQQGGGSACPRRYPS
jgi:IstB-like ATP binding protein